MKNSFLTFGLFLLAFFVTSCGGNRYEQLKGYIPSGAEASIEFVEDGLGTPASDITCTIPVVIGKDTVIANARIGSMFPGRFLLIFHHKHPLANTDRFTVDMTRDTKTGAYEVFIVSIKQK